MKQWYEELFTNYARKYDQQSFTAGTIKEVNFIENELGDRKGARILDVGCGTGRHAIELAKRGYDVTGIDLSPDQLNLAGEKARRANVNVMFFEQDARKLKFKEEFDLVIMICEGAFPLMETDEMNSEILMNVTRALKKGGKLIMTTLNGLYPLNHSLIDFSAQNQDDIIVTRNTFNPKTMRESSTILIKDDSGKEKQITTNERYYLPSEIENLLRSLGYSPVGIFGCTCGNFSRERRLTAEDYEMLVIAEK